MMVSTRGRYALRVMVDLAVNSTTGFVPLSDVAGRQEISEKYLESIVSALAKNKLLDSTRGKGGGYKLNRPASEYTVAEILKATEGSMAPVACLKDGADPCSRMENCSTLAMWKELYQLTDSFFSGISIQDLADGTKQI